MATLLINSNIGSETLAVEFKEFYINENKYIHNLRHFIQSAKITQDYIRCVTDNIHQYIHKYFLKYVSAYNNAHVKGILYIGIDNDGNIRGIPHINLTEPLIREYIEECKKNVINLSSEISNYINNVKIDVIELEGTPTPTIDLKTHLKKLNISSISEISKLASYVRKRQRLYYQLSKYHTKIYNVFNNKKLRNECMRYIKTFCRTTKLRLKMYHTLLHYPKNQITSDNIRIYKTHRNHIMFWVTEFRDYMSHYYEKQLREQTKTYNYKLINHDPYFDIFRDIKMSAPLLLQKNKDLKMFVIKLTFPEPIEEMIKYGSSNGKCSIDAHRALGYKGTPITLYGNECVT